MTPQVMVESFPYDGAQLTISEYEFSRCPACDEEVVLPDQARRNELRFTDAKRRHEQLLTSSEIIAWRGALGLTQAQAARLVGGGVNAFSKYERGEVMQSRPMDLLMRAALASKDARAMLFERAGMVSDGTAVGMSAWSVVKADAQTIFGNVMSAAVKGIAANDEVSPWHEVSREQYAVRC